MKNKMIQCLLYIILFILEILLKTLTYYNKTTKEYKQGYYDYPNRDKYIGCSLMSNSEFSYRYSHLINMNKIHRYVEGWESAEKKQKK